MYSDVLPFLCCPACAGQLAHAVEQQEGDDIVRGTLACAACSARYAIHEGIADFLGAPQPPTPAQVVNEWRLTGWAYERLWRPYALTILSGEWFPFRRELPIMVELAGARRGGLFVDVACSNGLYARALARTAGPDGHVIAVDHAMPMLRDARRRARTAGLRISFVRAEAHALPVQDGAAAGVVIGGSLNEMVPLAESLNEVQRVLRGDGRFMTMTLARATTSFGRALQTLSQPGGIVFHSADEWVALFRGAGLHTIERAAYGVVLFTLSVRA